MLDEARKRDVAANAVLGAAFALSAAQSPKDFVKTGSVESPGVAMMQRTIGNSRRKPKDLDKSAVMSRGTKPLEERTLMRAQPSTRAGRMHMPGAEGAARRDVSRAGFRRSGPIREPEVEKSGSDVPIWVRTHKSPAEFAAHTARQKYKERDGKLDVKSLKRQFHQTGAGKKDPVHDITVGSPKSKVKDPGTRARQFVGALKDVKSKMVAKGKGVATNTPTELPSSGKKKKRTDTQGAEQRGRIYSKLGMGERNPKTGVQMAKIKEGRTFGEFMVLAEMRKEDKVAGKQKTPLYISKTHKTVQSAPEGSGKKWERKDITTKKPNPVAKMGRFKQGRGMPGDAPHTTTGYDRGAGFGYVPHPHGEGGISRGVKRTQTIQKKRERAPEEGITPAQKVQLKRNRLASYSTGRRLG